MSFEIFNLRPDIMSGVRAAGYETPTPIQLKAIPPILEGRDVVGLAQTGTGKTAAFVLPILQRLAARPRGKIRAAVISPTRELAEQTCQAFVELGRHTGLRCLAVYGGVSMTQQLRQLRNGVEIVVGCPGRMLDHLWKGTLDFRDIEVLVIDEADRMFDMGFLPSIRNVLECILQPRQTLLFSATMPDSIRDLAREVVKDPVTVQIGRTLPANTVSHSLYPVPDDRKMPLLRQILSETDTESVLVFARTKHRADRIGRELQNAGMRATSLQGDMSQSHRQAAMEGFRDGSFKIMVATDIASRGLDVLSISHVINYDMPEDTDAYIHRIGRTGRIGRDGCAITFVTPRDGAATRQLETLLKCTIERRTLPDFDYSSTIPAAGRSLNVTHVHGRKISGRAPAAR
jgi:ATP-dependent RNA helicase RhlE